VLQHVRAERQLAHQGGGGREDNCRHDKEQQHRQPDAHTPQDGHKVGGAAVRLGDGYRRHHGDEDADDGQHDQGDDHDEHSHANEQVHGKETQQALPADTQAGAKRGALSALDLVDHADQSANAGVAHNDADDGEHQSDDEQRADDGEDDRYCGGQVAAKRQRLAPAVEVTLVDHVLHGATAVHAAVPRAEKGGSDAEHPQRFVAPGNLERTANDPAIIHV